jgi:hypothetical protein
MSVTAAEAVGAQPAASAAAATAAAFTAAATDSSADIAGAVSVVGDSCRRNSAAAAVPDLAAVSAVIDQLILSTMPEYEQQQQQDGGSLTVEELIRVLWSCCVFGSLDIAQFGWLLVAVAGGPWQRLGPEQLCVIKQGEVRGVYCYVCYCQNCLLPPLQLPVSNHAPTAMLPIASVCKHT